MEQWESLVKSFPSNPTHGEFRKAVNSAAVVLKEDLAPFEIEWILQTLLKKPVELLSHLPQHSNDNTWTAVIGTAFDLLTNVFEKHSAYMQAYIDDIVKISLVNYTALNRKRALTTLYMACINNIWSQHWSAIITSATSMLAGDDAATVKAARARLIGAICEHHPDTLLDGQEIKLWRSFLSILEGNKVSDALINGSLQGICGLFKNFGMNLPIAEISNNLYEKLSKQYILIGSCEEVCFQILTKYCNLFPEKICTDSVLRNFLWTLLLNGSKAADTLVSVYSTAIDNGNVQEIVTKEIYPRIYSKSPQERSLANRILSAILKKSANQMPEIRREFQKRASNTVTNLEFSLQVKVDTLTDKVKYDHDLMNLLEEASWCIEANITGSDGLLRSVLLLHEAIPSNRKRKLLVHVLLNADPGLRKAAINFLLSESIQPEVGIDRYLSIFEQIFDSKFDSDEIVDRNRQFVVDDTVNFLIKMLDAYLDEDVTEKTNQKISDILKLASQLLSMENFSCHLPRGTLANILELMMDVVETREPSEGMMLMMAGAVKLAKVSDEEVDFRVVEFVGNVPTQCSEAFRCARCIAVLALPTEIFLKGEADINVLLEALQVILTRNDVENETLVEAVQKLDEIFSAQDYTIDSQIENNIIQNVARLKERRIFKGKSGRVLERDIVLFLGKYGGTSEFDSYNDSSVTVKESLCVNIPNLSDGTTMKLNVSRIYDLAMKHEQPEVMNALLVIICAYLSNKSDTKLQRALAALIVKLSICHSRMEGGGVDSLLVAVSLCDKEDCAGVLFEHIIKETSPGARKILSNILSHLLALEPYSEAAVRRLQDEVMLIIKHGAANEKKSALDFVENLLDTMTQNNELYKELAPELFAAILKSRDHVTFKIFTEKFLEKILLFDRFVLENILEDIKLFLNENAEFNVDFLKVTLALLKGISDVLDLTEKYLLENINNKTNTKFLRFIVEVKQTFVLDVEKCRHIINCLKDDFIYSKYQVKSTEDVKTVLSFIQSYADVLLELKYKETLTFMGEAIQDMSAKQIKFLYSDLKKCVETIKSINGQMPQMITKSIEDWISKVTFEELTRDLKMEYITVKDEITVNALCKLLRLLNTESQKYPPSDCFKEWIDILMKFHIDESLILKTKMAVLNDVLAVALNFFNPLEAAELCRNSLPFVRFFIGPFSMYLMEKVFVHLDIKTVAVLYKDILSFYGTEKISKDDVSRLLKCFIEIWPRLEKDLLFEEQHSIMVKMLKINNLTVDTECQPVDWWLREMLKSEGERKIKMIQVLPLFLQGGSEEYRKMFVTPLNTLSAILPVRVTSRDPPAAILSSLIGLAACGHETLARQVLVTVLDDNIPPWLESALEQSMTSLLIKHGSTALKMIFDICTEDEFSIHLFDRALGPMIRAASHQVCQDFFSAVLPSVLSTLWRKPKAGGVGGASQLVKGGRAFTVARWCFEKMSLQALESTSSPLYANIELKRSKNLAQELCKLCVTLRSDVTRPNDNELALKCFRYFQSSNYNCLAAVLLKTKPQAKFFEHVLKPEIWTLLIDCERSIVVYIEALGKNQLKRHHTAVSDATGGTSGATTFTRRTLSDNPFQYDMMDELEPVMCETEAILLSDNELNDHPCAAALCATLRHLSTAEQGPATWLRLLVDGLSGPGNVSWFLAQAIINCKEEIKKFASELAPALLAVVAQTTYKREEKQLLNGLHINILNTIHYWHESNPIENDTAPSDINSVVQMLLDTCIHHKQRNSVLETIIKCLGHFVEVYGEHIKINWAFIEEILTDQSNESIIYNILETITKQKLFIPELLTSLVSKIVQSGRQTHVAKLLGLALSVCHDVSVRLTALTKLRKQLDRLKTNSQDFVKVLFYVQNGCAEACTESYFRHITDLAPKMVRDQRTKCFKIIANFISTYTETNEYITAMFETIDICDAIISDDTDAALRLAQCGLTLMSESLKRRAVHLSCSFCDSSSVETRKAAFGVVLRAAEEFLTHTGETFSKKSKTEGATKILKILESEDVYKRTVLAHIGLGVTDQHKDVRILVVEKVSELLDDQDMCNRFLEAIAICIILPLTTLESRASKMRSPQSVTAAVGMLVKGYTQKEGFARVLLRDEPLAISANQSNMAPPKLLTMSRTFQGTFRTGLSRGSKWKAIEPEKRMLEVQKPIKELLDVFLEFSERNIEVATSLFVGTLRQLTSGEACQLLARQLLTVLSKDVTELTPCVMEACRLCVEQCALEPSFESCLKKLLKATRRTEGYELTKLLYEEALLAKADESSFIMGKWSPDDYHTEMEEVSKEFSIEGMLSCFDKLSNWDELTIQRKRKIKSSLPVLWTDEQTFRTALKVPTDIPYWLSQMRLAYEQTNLSAGDQYMELKGLDKWPRNPFVMSCLTEIVQWRSIEDGVDWRKVPCDIKPADCLVEWAARIMARSCLASDMERNDINGCAKQIRIQQLLWCTEARERELLHLVPACVKLNIPHLTESEIRPWLHQQCLMLRSQGLKEGNQEMLKKALEKLETIAPNFETNSDELKVSELCLKIQLHRDLKSLSKEAIETYLTGVLNDIQPSRLSSKNAKNILSVLENCMDYYNCAWEDNTATNKEEVLSSMSTCISQLNCFNLKSDMSLCTILSRLEEYNGNINEYITEKILEALSPLADNFDEQLSENFSSLKHKLEQKTIERYPKIKNLLQKDNNGITKCLELICDPDYSLMQYCERLTRALNENDEKVYNATFLNMKSFIFENGNAGASYQLLARYKSELYGIAEFEHTEKLKNDAKSTLKRIYLELQKLPPKGTLNMADICLSLSRPLSERDGDSVARTLGLVGMTVVKFEKQVQVYTKSLRRPCVVTALLGSGHTKRFIVKRGEPLQTDAAAGRCVEALNACCQYRSKVYRVTPLSEDCGIIEYLEDHVTIRSLIAEKYRLDEIGLSVRRADDAAPAPRAALAQFKEMCAKVPPNALRTEKEAASACVQEFIVKKRNFQDSVAAMAVQHWILGLGDRHLENLMVCTQDGGACAVDFAAILQFGGSSVPEIPPARLTRLLVAVCDREVLECRMQSVLQSLRRSYRTVLPVLRYRLGWVPNSNDDFEMKITHIRDILQGRALSHHVTEAVLLNADVKYKENYCAILDEVLRDFPLKESYGVDEQISSLLKQSTDTRILSVTRMGWEPWL